MATQDQGGNQPPAPSLAQRVGEALTRQIPPATAALTGTSALRDAARDFEKQATIPEAENVIVAVRHRANGWQTGVVRQGLRTFITLVYIGENPGAKPTAGPVIAAATAVARHLASIGDLSISRDKGEVRVLVHGPPTS